MTRVFKEGDVVRLRTSDEACGVSTSCTGTVVDVLAPGVYTVEFVDEHGDTVMEALHRAYYERELVKV